MKTTAFPIAFPPTGKRLFVKIFWVFWLAMSVAGVVLLAIEAERVGRLEKRATQINGAAIAFYAVSVTKDHEDEQSWESRAFLKDLEARTGIRGWLFDTKGREVSGHDKPDLLSLQRQTHLLPQLIERAQTSNETIFQPLGAITLAAHASTAPSGKHYTFVGVLPRSRFGPWNALPRVQVLRLLAVLATAGVVSWILALHLTRPIATLREATHRLAEGDLSARAMAAEFQRDELGELSRDFNMMAERLENAMHEQSRLIEAQKRLIGDVAHELRSPLTRILVALELARDASDGSEDEGMNGNLSLVAAHDRIERETGRLNDLIARLLTLSRLESGTQKRDDAPIELPVLVESVVEDADYEARPGKHVRFINRLIPVNGETASPKCVVLGTPELIQSALENVVRNAVRHTPEGTSVEVELWRERNDVSNSERWTSEADGSYVSPPPSTLTPPSFMWAVVSVRDYGPGVASDELRNVFRPFYRAGKGRALRDGGVGLGLAITLRAVELHGGQVRTCNAEGGGFFIEIRLPLPSENLSQELQ